MSTLDDREIAIAHLALYDAESGEEAIARREHIRKHFDSMADEIHSGDCTKQPWSCSRCLTEEAFKMVPVYRELFGLSEEPNAVEP